MGRKRPETAKSRLAKQLIESYDIKTAQDIQEALKDLQEKGLMLTIQKL